MLSAGWRNIHFLANKELQLQLRKHSYLRQQRINMDPKKQMEEYWKKIEETGRQRRQQQEQQERQEREVRERAEQERRLEEHRRQYREQQEAYQRQQQQQQQEQLRQQQEQMRQQQEQLRQQQLAEERERQRRNNLPECDRGFR
jgi:hypothetical protein